MRPADLKPADFRAYPPLSRAFATENLSVLKRLPLALAALMLREVLAYDWKFPAERKDLERQFAFLAASTTADFEKAAGGFNLQLTPELQDADWVNQPALFSEKMTAHLWATHQIEKFRGAAIGLVAAVNASLPEEAAPIPRIAIVLIGKDATASEVPLFRKLRPFGTHFTSVEEGDGYRLILTSVQKRATAHPLPYSHWYIDGGNITGLTCAALTSISYESIRPLRIALQSRMQSAWAAGMGSETLRTTLAQLQPKDFGLHGDPVFDRLQLSLLSEASGTQIYSTTFAQWAAREVLRRAQPQTLLLRFAPRQRERAMSEMLEEGNKTPPLDPAGSLRDADLGAYYTWLNLQRLTGAADSSFLVWFENHKEALLISPKTARARTVADRVEWPSLIAQVGLG